MRAEEDLLWAENATRTKKASDYLYVKRQNCEEFRQREKLRSILFLPHILRFLPKAVI